MKNSMLEASRCYQGTTSTYPPTQRNSRTAGWDSDTSSSQPWHDWVHDKRACPVCKLTVCTRSPPRLNATQSHVQLGCEQASVGPRANANLPPPETGIKMGIVRHKGGSTQRAAHTPVRESQPGEDRAQAQDLVKEQTAAATCSHDDKRSAGSGPAARVSQGGERRPTQDLVKGLTYSGRKHALTTTRSAGSVCCSAAPVLTMTPVTLPPLPCSAVTVPLFRKEMPLAVVECRVYMGGWLRQGSGLSRGRSR